MGILSKLTDREREIAEFVRLAMRNREIAVYFGTTEQVIKNEVKTIFDKVGCDNRLQLAVWLTRDLLQQSLQRASCHA